MRGFWKRGAEQEKPVPAPSVMSLNGNPTLPLAVSNLKALKARPCIAPDWKFRAVTVHEEIYNKTRRAYPYFGEVQVVVTGTPLVRMLSHNDDMVACIYFYFGRDAYESLSVRLFAEFAKGAEAVLDIGAFTGLFGLVAARVEPKALVTSFEPLPHIAERARLNGELNGLTNYQVKAQAVSGVAGAAALTLYGGTTATTGASLAKKTRSDIGSITVDVTTIDDYARGLGDRRVRLIKLDTEGDEVAAIVGGAQTLATQRPVVLAEVLNDKAVADQTGAMAAHGYKAWYVDEKARRLVAVGDGFTLAKRGYGNLLFAADEACVARAQAVAEAFCEAGAA